MLHNQCFRLKFFLYMSHLHVHYQNWGGAQCLNVINKVQEVLILVETVEFLGSMVLWLNTEKIKSGESMTFDSLSPWNLLQCKHRQKGNVFVVNNWSTNARLNKYQTTRSTPIICSHYQTCPQHCKYHTTSDIERKFTLCLVYTTTCWMSVR